MARTLDDRIYVQTSPMHQLFYVFDKDTDATLFTIPYSEAPIGMLETDDADAYPYIVADFYADELVDMLEAEEE